MKAKIILHLSLFILCHFTDANYLDENIKTIEGSFGISSASFSIGLWDTITVPKVHAYDCEQGQETYFCAELPLTEINNAILSSSLKGIDVSQSKTFTLSIQSLKRSMHPSQFIGFKPQWTFFKDFETSDPTYDHGSHIQCWTKIVSLKGEEDLTNKSAYVNFHNGDKGEYRVSPPEPLLNFTGDDNLSRAILYHVNYNNGNGVGAQMNGKSKTGVILLLNNEDFPNWEKNCKEANTLKNSLLSIPLVKDNQLLKTLLNL